MSKPERDYREGVDALQEDMARHQRRFAPEVTADANQKLAAATIERLEKEDAESKPAPPPHLPPTPPPSVTKREIDGRKYTVDVAPDTQKLYRTATEFEQQVLKHAQPRIEMLLGKPESGPLGSPSWRERTLAAMYFKVKSLEARAAHQHDLARNYELAFQLDLQELLDASSQAFGDWKKSPDRRIQVGGGA